MSETSFENLVKGYSRQVLNTAVRILGNTQQAQDVHQEVFLGILKRWHQYNGQINWKGYLYRTTIRKALASTKKKKTEPLNESNSSCFSSGPEPDERIKMTELRDKLSKEIAKLPQRQAEVFILARIEGVKYEKISEILGCSQETVRVHLHRAIKVLADKLGEHLP